MKKALKLLTLSFFIFIFLLTCNCDEKEVLTPNVPLGEAKLTVSFIDVGQGDSTLIECEGEAMLIDAGTYSSHIQILDHLNKRKIKNLEYCVATHPHSDHIGGMSEIINAFNVETLVYPLCEENTYINSVLDVCDEKGVSYYNPEAFDTFTLGGATITVLSPQKDEIYSNLNNYSLVLKLEYKDVSFLFTGDAESPVEAKLVYNLTDLKTDVLKCGHHGSATSTSFEFLNAVNPAAAVISCGMDNDYGHPHPETLRSLAYRNIETYRTDLMSTIVAASDGKNISFYYGGELSDTTHPATEANSTYFYVGNKQSGIFHDLNCSALKTMKDKNKVYFTTREKAVFEGYDPCQNCNP